MVKIPALELDGQNWKIYRAKLLEHAATQNLLNVLAGGPDEDWEGCNALLHELLHDTIPISIYIRLRRNTAHQVFKYLAKRFRDRDPIADPRAKKLATCTNDDKRYPSAKSPTSENAVIGAEREDLSTKALTRGTEDVNDRNVGREDPRTSLEASAKGNSAKSAGTSVLLKGEPHETQNVPQNSLPLTLRLPIEGEPNECKQEVAESVVTAGRTIGTVEMANPREMDADVDRTALLGRDLAERACGVDESGRMIADVDRTALLVREPVERASGVDEGDETERKDLRLQKTRQYCEESCQHSGNANADAPSAHGLPLEGEWTGCASGKTTNSNGDADVLNAAIERVCGPSESRETEDAMENELRGCGEGASGRASVDELETIVECCQQLCMADSNPGHGIQPADVPNESDPLVTRSVEPYVENGETSVRVHLQGASWRADDTNGAGHGAEGLMGETDVSRGSTDMLGTSNSTGTAGISHGDGAGTYLDAGGAKRVIDATVGVGSHADASNGHTDVPSVQTNALTTANVTENVSIPRKRAKPLNSPKETARRRPDKPNGCGSHADTSSVHTDVHSVGSGTQTAGNETKSIRTRQNSSRTQDSPNGGDISTPKRTYQWRRVSVSDGDVYVPRNAPVVAIETANRIFAFGEVESRVEAIAPSVESERAGDGDGDGYGDDGGDGDVGDTTSGGSVHSKRVEAALLAGDSQLERQSRRIRTGNLPVSSGPPIQSTERPYGPIRRRRRRGRLKIERINVSKAQQVQNGQTTHLGLDRIAQPPRSAPDRACMVYRPRRQRGRIKIAPINVSRTRNGGNAYLGRAIAMRSTRRPKKQTRRVNTLTFESRMPREPWRDDEDYG